MSDTELDPVFAGAVRDELVTIGTKKSRLQRHQRNRRLTIAGILAVAVATATTASALVVNAFPGSTTVTPLGATHSATHTGTGHLQLGPAPKGATRVILTVRCLNSTGKISVDAVPQNKYDSGGFATFYCSVQSMEAATGQKIADTGAPIGPWHMNDAKLPPHGSTAITITADPGTTWAITGQYATSFTTPWAKNARGQTYGGCNYNGCPDLMGAQATNGKIGFVLSAQEGSFRGSGYIPVYQSDGTTIIGKFSIGIPYGQITK